MLPCRKVGSCFFYYCNLVPWLCIDSCWVSRVPAAGTCARTEVDLCDGDTRLSYPASLFIVRSVRSCFVSLQGSAAQGWSLRYGCNSTLNAHAHALMHTETQFAMATSHSVVIISRVSSGMQLQVQLTAHSTISFTGLILFADA